MSRNAIVGGAVWIGLAAASQLHWARLNTIEMLFLLGPLVIVPLGLGLCFQLTIETQVGLSIRIARNLQLPAALSLIASFWFPQGFAATIAALPWFVFGC